MADLLVEYGVTFLVIHYLIFGLVIVGAWFAIKAGWRPESSAGQAGSWVAAYVVAKVVQIPRMLVAAALTPVAARYYERISGRKPPSFGGRPAGRGEPPK